MGTSIMKDVIVRYTKTKKDGYVKYNYGQSLENLWDESLSAKITLARNSCKFTNFGWQYHAAYSTEKITTLGQLL